MPAYQYKTQEGKDKHNAWRREYYRKNKERIRAVITQTRGSGAGKIRNSALRLKSTPERKSTLGTTQIRNAFARQSAQRNRLRRPHKIDF